MVDASTHWIRPAARPVTFALAPRRHRRPVTSPYRKAGLIGAGVVALLFFVFALFAADWQPIGPDRPFGAPAPTGSPDVPPASVPSVALPAGGGSAPADRDADALPPPVSGSPGWEPAAAQPPVPPAVAPEPRPTAPQISPQPPEPSPPVPVPSPQPSAAQPPAPQPSPQPPASGPGSQGPPNKPSHPAKPSPPRPDDGAHPGEPGGNPSPPGHQPRPTGPKVDQQYASCEDVLAAGLGPYKAARDVEYAWYADPDADGWACESPRWGMGRK